MKKKKMIKIGLMGFEFSSPNKGCEALTYSFVEILRQLFKEKELIIFSFCGTSLGDIPSRYPDIHFLSVNPRIKDIRFRYIRAIRACSFIFDVTMGDSFSDIYSVTYCRGLIKQKRIVEMFAKKYILLPQTYGPFNDRQVKKEAIKVINKASFVISRDQKSIDYLKEIGIKRNITKQIDLAFFLPFSKNKFDVDNKGRINVGINVSGLLWKGGFISSNQFEMKLDYKCYIGRLIEYFLSNKIYRIHLISHVVDLSDNPYDDDYQVSKGLSIEHPEIVLAPAFDNPIDAKSYISKMDLFIGSRMHSTIAALSSSVPVIPVSYSRKFEGLYSYLDYHFLVHGKEETTEEAIEKTIKWISDISELKSKVLEIQSTIESERESLLKGFKEYLVK